MDTQVLAALKNVRMARNEVNLARLDRTLPLEQQGMLTQLYLDLDDLEGRLILSDLRSQLGALKQETADLGATVDQLRGAVQSLRGLADKVQAAATAVNAVVSVVQTASSLKII